MKPLFAKVLTCLLIGLALAGLSSPLSAQSTGRLAGAVKDPSGAAVPDALVSLYRPGMTDPANQTKTTGDGLFQFDALPPESYRVTIEKAGFAMNEATDVRVSPGTEATLNGIVLSLGSQPTIVSTSEKMQGVQTGNAEVSTTLTTEQLDRLPVLNRNPLDLVKTQAGVSFGAGQTPFTTINGLRTSYSNVTLDSVNIQDNTVRYNGLDFVPNNLRIGQVSQFSLVTSNQGAIYGNGATQTAFVSPSGTNDLHGSLFYLNSPNPFNANSWFQSALGLQDKYKSNQGGVTIGAPLIRNKLFGYAAYEFLRVNDSVVNSAYTFGIQTINILHSLPTDPFVANLLSKIQPSNTTDPFGNSIYANRQPFRRTADNATGKLDLLLSQKHTISASYLWNRLNEDVSLSAFGNRPATTEEARANLWSLAWRFSPTSRLTNELRAGGNIAPIALINRERTGSLNVDLGVLDFVNPISSAPNEGRRLHTYDFQDNGSYTIRRHALQFGFQAQLIRTPAYTESGAFGAVPTENSGARAGQNTLALTTVPTIVLGDASQSLSGQLSAVLRGNVRFYYGLRFPVDRTGTFAAAPYRSSISLDNYAPYFQDNWKVSPKLALTLGLRYDYYTPVRDDSGLLYVPQLVNSSVLQTIATSKINYQIGGNNLYQAEKHNFAPNIGVAFDPFGNGKTAVRAAYGLSYVNDDVTEAVRRTLVGNAANIGSALFFTTRPINISSIPPIPAPPNGTSISASGGQAGIVNPLLRTPYVQQWSMGVQQELHGFVLDARYVGNHAVKMLRRDVEQTSPGPFGYYAYMSNGADSTYNAMQVDVSRRLGRGLQLQANYTYGKVLTDSNTISAAFSDPYRDPANHRLDRGPALFDIRHAFKANFIYDLRFTGSVSMPGPVRAIVNGWSVSTILIAQTGGPFSILAYDRNRARYEPAVTTLGGSALDNVVAFHMTGAGPSIIADRVTNPKDSSGIGGFAGQAFFAPTSGAGGLQPRMFYGPAAVNWDLGLQRRFRITERHSLEIRAIAVNVLNHPSFGFGDQYIDSQGFGQNAFRLFTPRTIQLSAYYRF